MNEQVLVIDDEAAIVESLCDFLRIKKITCRGESNPQKAVENFRSNPTDVVIVDYLLSGIEGLTGLDIISQLKEIKPFTRFILISAFKLDSNNIADELADRVKVDRFIPKPPDNALLFEYVSELLESIESKTDNWLAIAKEYVSKETISADEVRRINEEFKQSIIEAFDKEEDKE